MTRTKRTAVAFVAGLLALGLAACGRADGAERSDPTTAALPSGKPTGTLTVWAMGVEGDVLPKIATEFEAANPGLRVEITAVPWQDAPKKITTAIAGGRTPDMTMVGASDLPSYVAADGFQPVPDGLVADSSFYRAAWDSVKVDGAAYAVPWYVETRSMFYRKDWAAKAGLAVPTTWAEFTEFSAKLKEAGGAKQGLSLPTGQANATWQAFMPFFWQTGAKDLTADGAFNYDSDEMRAALTEYQSFFANGSASRNGFTQFGQAQAAFAAGDIGATITGPWDISQIQQIAGDQFVADSLGIAVLPSGPDNNAGYIGGGHWSVFRDAQNPGAAWSFIKWLAEVPQQQKLFGLTSDLPAVRDAWDLPALKDDPFMQAFNSQLETAAAPPLIPTWGQIGAVVDTEIEKLAKGQATPEQVAATLQQRATAIGTGS